MYHPTFLKKTQHTKMNTFSHLAFVYFNGAKSPLQYRVSGNTPLVDLKFKMDYLP